MLYFVLDAIGSPNTYPCQSVGQWVIDSFRFGDSYRISELCKLVIKKNIFHNIGGKNFFDEHTKLDKKALSTHCFDQHIMVNPILTTLQQAGWYYKNIFSWLIFSLDFFLFFSLAS